MIEDVLQQPAVGRHFALRAGQAHAQMREQSGEYQQDRQRQRVDQQMRPVEHDPSERGSRRQDDHPHSRWGSGSIAGESEFGMGEQAERAGQCSGTSPTHGRPHVGEVPRQAGPWLARHYHLRSARGTGAEDPVSLQVGQPHRAMGKAGIGFHALEQVAAVEVDQQRADAAPTVGEDGCAYTEARGRRLARWCAGVAELQRRDEHLTTVEGVDCTDHGRVETFLSRRRSERVRAVIALDLHHFAAVGIQQPNSGVILATGDEHRKEALHAGGYPHGRRSECLLHHPWLGQGKRVAADIDQSVGEPTNDQVRCVLIERLRVLLQRPALAERSHDGH